MPADWGKRDLYVNIEIKMTPGYYPPINIERFS